jgi:hypothetical protein
MYGDYRIVCVTPAGRRRYMEMLAGYILQSAIVDEYQIWVNTKDRNDLAFFRGLRGLDPRVSIVWPPEYPVAGRQSIGQFFRNCIDSDSIYIRFDDDIVWISDNFFEEFLEFRLRNPQYFIVSPLVINNALCTYVLQVRNLLRSDYGHVQPYLMDPIGWANPRFAHHLHNLLLHTIAVDDLESLMFDEQPMALCRFSINCIAWFGREFAAFGGRVPQLADEEEWVSAVKPTALGQGNCVFGRAMASHFAFLPQRPYLDKTDVLARYRNLATRLPNLPRSTVIDGLSISGGPSSDYPDFLEKLEVLLLRESFWHYSRSDGVTVCSELRLLPDGRIDGYHHFNESRWEIRKGWFCFVDGHGRVSTRFHRLEFVDDCRLRATGVYLFSTVEFNHVLTQRDAL